MNKIGPCQNALEFSHRLRPNATLPWRVDLFGAHLAFAEISPQFLDLVDLAERLTFRLPGSPRLLKSASIAIRVTRVGGSGLPGTSPNTVFANNRRWKASPGALSSAPPPPSGLQL